METPRADPLRCTETPDHTRSRVPAGILARILRPGNESIRRPGEADRGLDSGGSRCALLGTRAIDLGSAPSADGRRRARMIDPEPG